MTCESCGCGNVGRCCHIIKQQKEKIEELQDLLWNHAGIGAKEREIDCQCGKWKAVYKHYSRPGKQYHCVGCNKVMEECRC